MKIVLIEIVKISIYQQTEKKCLKFIVSHLSA